LSIEATLLLQSNSEKTKQISFVQQLEQIEKGAHDMLNDGNVFGALKYVGGFGGWGGPESGRPAHLKKLQARLEVLETRNTELQGKLSTLE
jgi:hypothetical protein